MWGGAHGHLRGFHVCAGAPRGQFCADGKSRGHSLPPAASEADGFSQMPTAMCFSNMRETLLESQGFPLTTDDWALKVGKPFCFLPEL